MDLMYLWVRDRWYFLVSVLDSYSRFIVHWELALSMRAQEIAEIILHGRTAWEKVPGKKPRVVRDNGSQFLSKEWREVIRHFELEEIPIRVRHPESNGRIERYLHGSKKEKGKILDEFTKITGRHRKAAIRLFRHSNQPSGTGTFSNTYPVRL